MVNLDIYTDPSRDAVQALRSNIIVEVEVEEAKPGTNLFAFYFLHLHTTLNFYDCLKS